MINQTALERDVVRVGGVKEGEEGAVGGKGGLEGEGGHAGAGFGG